MHVGMLQDHRLSVTNSSHIAPDFAENRNCFNQQLYNKELKAAIC